MSGDEGCRSDIVATLLVTLVVVVFLLVVKINSLNREAGEAKTDIDALQRRIARLEATR